MNKYKFERKKMIFFLVRELHGIGTPESMQVAAEYSVELEKMSIPRDWLRVVWYSDECGGKLVRFKAGNPYGRKKCVKNNTPEKNCPKNATKSDNPERLAASLSRTKRRIYELAACNEWAWFFTGTLDGEKCDRNDLNNTFKRLSQYVRDYRKQQQGARIVYMIVPEQHKNGAWHFHGLLQGITEDELYKFTTRDNIPKKLKDRIKKGEDIFTWLGYQERFGWATLTRVKSHAAISKYVTKYITKDLQQTNRENNAHLYYASKGLKAPEIIAEGQSKNGLLPYTDFENEWVALRAIPDRKEADTIVARYIDEKKDIIDPDYTVDFTVPFMVQ